MPVILALFCCVVFAFCILDETGRMHVLSDPYWLWIKVLKPLARITVFIAAGLFAGILIEAMGWTGKLSTAVRPFMRWGHLSGRTGSVFTTAFFSGTAALSMLMSFHKDGRMDEKGVLRCVLLNTFPSYFLHLPTTFFILLALAGRAGAVYLALTFGAALSRFAAVLAWSRFTLPEAAPDRDQPPAGQGDRAGIWKKAKTRFIGRLGRVLGIVLPVYLVFAVMAEFGFFVWLRTWLAGRITSVAVPVESMSIVIFSLVTEFTSGYAAAGAMLDAGSLTVAQTVLALLLGNIIATPVRALRHQFPYYAGIFGPALGTRLMLKVQAFRAGSLVIVGMIYLLWVQVV